MDIRAMLNKKRIKIGNHTISMLEACEIKDIYEAMMTAEYIIENYENINDIDIAYDIALDVRERMNEEDTNEVEYIEDVIEERIENAENK